MFWQMSGTVKRTRLAASSQYIWHIPLRKQHSKRGGKKNNPRTQQKDSQVPLIRFPWRYTNVTNCTFKQPTKINAYIPRPLVPHLPHNSVCFDPYPGFWLPSNLENFIQIYKSVSTPKTYRYTRCPFFVLALCYSSWGSELLEREGRSSLSPLT